MTEPHTSNPHLSAEEYGLARGLSPFTMPTFLGKSLGECTKSDFEELARLMGRVLVTLEKLSDGVEPPESDLTLLERFREHQRELWNWAINAKPNPHQ